jgi:hypothetical protein
MKSKKEKSLIIIFLIGVIFLFGIKYSRSNGFLFSELLGLSQKNQILKTRSEDHKPYSPISEMKKIIQGNNVSVLSPSNNTAKDLRNAYKNGDVCEVMSWTGEEKPYAIDEQIKMYFSLPNPFSQNSELNRTSEYVLTNLINEEKIDPEAPVDTNNIIEFYRALVYGKLIDPSDGYESFVDYKKAEQILLALELKEPDNAAFPLFRAAVQLNEGASEESLRPLITKAMQAKFYDDFHTTIWRPVLQRSFQSSVSFVMSQMITHSARIVQVSKAMAIIKNLIISGDAQFAALAEAFAKKLKPVYMPQGGRFEFFEWDILNYAWGEVLNYNAKKILHPGENVPFAKKPTDLLTFRNEPIYKDTFPETSDGTPKKCDALKMQNYIKNEERIYTAYFGKLAGHGN